MVIINNTYIIIGFKFIIMLINITVVNKTNLNS